MDRETARRQVEAIRRHTVANGATPEAAANASRLADRLEERYGLREEGSAEAVGRREAGSGRPRGNRVIVTATQYRALIRGGVATKVELGERLRFRLTDGVLFRWSEVDGETEHRVLSAQPSCGNVIIRHT